LPVIAMLRTVRFVISEVSAMHNTSALCPLAPGFRAHVVVYRGQGWIDVARRYCCVVIHQQLAASGAQPIQLSPAECRST
jgi:hypothetical protein